MNKTFAEYKNIHPSFKLLIAIVCILILTTLMAGCEDVGKESVEVAVRALDDLIRKLESQSENWQALLEETKDTLIKEGQSTVANEVSNVLSNAISDIGIQARCTVNFLVDRVKEELIQIRASLTGEHVSPSPGFCMPIPDVIDMNLSAERRTHYRIDGYNIDVKDIELFLIQIDGSRIDVSNQLGNPTDYLLTIDLGGQGVPLSSESDMLELILPNGRTRPINIIQPITPQALAYTINYDNSYSVVGGGYIGGNTWGDTCPWGFVATGLIGRYGALIDQIGLQCSFLNKDGTTIFPGNTKRHGGSGGEEFTELICPPNQVLVGVKGKAGDYVDQIYGICASVDGTKNSETGEVGKPGGVPFDSSVCQDGYVITGYFGRFGQFVDQINFTCTEVTMR